MKMVCSSVKDPTSILYLQDSKAVEMELYE